MNTKNENPYAELLRSAIVEAARAIDPMRQSECWPDPIAWDGRPLDEQASDMLAIVETPSVYAALESYLMRYREAAEGGAL